MKSILPVVFAGITTVLGQPDPAACQRVRMADYEIPVSDLRDLDVSVSGNAEIQEWGQDSWTTSRNESYSGTFFQFHDSPDHGYETTVHTSAYHRDSRSSSGSSHTSLSTDFHISTLGKRYRRNSDLFLYGRFQGRLEPSVSTDAIRHDWYADELIGAGWGRFVEATPLARAFRLEEELEELGLLEGPLPDRTLLELAEILTPEVRDSYTSERLWENAYFRAIEGVLLSSGRMLPSRLDPAAVIRIQKVLEEDVGPKFSGFEVYGGLGNHFTFRAGGRSEILRMAEGGLRLGVPFSYRTQFNLDLSAGRTATTGTHDFISIRASSQLIYEIGNRYDIRFAYAYTQEESDYPSGTGASPSLLVTRGHALTTLFSYWLEEKTSLDLGVDFFRSTYRDDSRWKGRAYVLLSRDIF